MSHLEFTRRPTAAHIQLDNLTYNLKSIKSFVGEDLLFMAVVKADAYGHGAVKCASRLEPDVDWFGVALLEEAIELRQAGIWKPILCLGGVWPGQESALLEHEITPAVFDLDHARRISRAAQPVGRKASIHVKIDTGMGRVGVPFSEVTQFVKGLANIPHLQVDGLMSHLAAADDLSQSEFTRKQIDMLHSAGDIFRRAGLQPSIIDMANSPGAVAYPGSRENMVRIGGLLYGLGGDVLPKGISKPDLKAVMSLSTRVAQVKRMPAGCTLGYGRTFSTTRESLIGTLPIGYRDGYRRDLSGKASVIVNGKLAPVAGRISMDWTIVDLTEIPETKVGDTAVLIGQDSGLSISAEDLAAAIGSISYEITCGISERVSRDYS